MTINSENKVTLKEANEKFLEVTKLVDKQGVVVITENNKPKYIISKAEPTDLVLTDDEKLEIIAKRILKEHKHAFEVLGQ